MLAIWFSIRYFSSAFPIIPLNIEMNRVDAQNYADSLAERYGWGPEKYRTAASFTHENIVQYFIELEGGGKSAFTQMIQSGLYMPYTWNIRHYADNETNETSIYLTPDGTFYGLEEQISEDAPGPSLEDERALALAEDFVIQEFDIDLAPYARVEDAIKVQPSGRTDHIFIYERTDESIGEGRFRLRIAVRGDRVTEIMHFIKIPESFSRRYREMRSSNETIAHVALFAVVILYLIGGCVIGFYYLIHNHLISWRGPLTWAIAIALLQMLDRLNNFPLLWMSYDTALSMHVFILEQLVGMILWFIGTSLIYTIIFMAAEGLTRQAFPNQIQFWKLWSQEVANTHAVLKRTISGYLAVPVFFAFEVILYLYTTKLFGWWSPADVLFEPDVLATYFPWFSSIAVSLEAGFLEECLFRAIPIAGAVILARRFGYKRIVIPAAMLIQALIFGAVHANYVQQPSYARLIELILPAMSFALIYYFWGLLPAIILHFCYDVIWIAIPLIVSSAGGIWIDRAIIILLAFIPLWIILFNRLKSGRWTSVEEAVLNKAWRLPASKPITDNRKSSYTYQPNLEDRRLLAALIIMGILGLLLWINFTDFDNVDPELKISREEIQQRTSNTFTRKGINLDSSWTTLISTVRPLGDEDEFIWQVGGPTVYTELMGSYISPPLWRSRIVKFHGDIVDRAEEYQLFFDGDGECIRFRHKIPERWPGAELTLIQARDIAMRVLRDDFSSDTTGLKETYAAPIKQQHRMDWHFIYSDTVNYTLERGEARISVSICGDEVSDAFRYIHVPEEWKREQQNKEKLFSQIIIIADIIVFILFTGLLVGSIIIIHDKRFSIRLFLWSLVIIFILSVLDLINQWPQIIADFSTSRPFMHQAFTTLAFPILGSLFVSSGPALIMGFIQSLKRNQKCEYKLKCVIIAWLPGLIVTGMYAAVSYFFQPSLKPLWSNSDVAGYLIPTLGIALYHLPAYVMDTIIAALIFIAIDRFSDSWTEKKVLSAILFMITIFLIHGNNASSLKHWIILGTISSVIYFLLYVYMFRYQLSLIPIFMGSVIIMNLIRETLINSYWHVLGTILGILMILSLAIAWFLILCRDRNTLKLHEFTEKS